MCLCFMCSCFGVHQLGELHFHRITRGNPCSVCLFVCVRVLWVCVLVCTSLASYISIALREVIRLPPASIDPSLSPILSKPATPHFWSWINPALYVCFNFSVFHFTTESNSSSSPSSKAWHIGFLEGRCQRGILIRSQSITHFNKRCQLTQDKQEIMHSLLSEDFKQPAVHSTLFL